MKALFITWDGQRDGADPQRTYSALCSLDSLGIDYTWCVAEELQSGATINAEYDLIVIPRQTGQAAIRNMIDNAAITLPMFCVGITGAAAMLGANPGITGLKSAVTDQFVTVPWTTSEWLAVYSYAFELTDGKALMTVTATEPDNGDTFTGATQTNAGQVCMWRGGTAGGNYLYCSSLDPFVQPMLPFLIQEAINDGKLSKPPRQAPIGMDLDHINGSYVSADPTILDQLAAWVPKGGVLTCGIADWHTDVLEDMNTVVSDKLKKYAYPNGPFKYCYHEHREPIMSGTFPNTVELKTKPEQEALYIARKSAWEAHGLPFHDNMVYNSGTNQFNENSLAVMSGDTTITADGDDLVTQAGFGRFRVIRSTTVNADRSLSAGTKPYNHYAQKTLVHGMLLLPTSDMAFMVNDTATKWRNTWFMLVGMLNRGGTLYHHDEDFILADQAPGIAGKQHGYTTMGLFLDFSAYHTDIAVCFANPSDYHPDMSISMS